MCDSRVVVLTMRLFCIVCVPEFGACERAIQKMQEIVIKNMLSEEKISGNVIFSLQMLCYN